MIMGHGLETGNFTWSIGSQSFKLNMRLFRVVDVGRKKSIQCKKLILAAGVVGSTEILLKSLNTTRTTGQKLNLSNKIGSRYSINGDSLGVVHPTKQTSMQQWAR